MTPTFDLQILKRSDMFAGLSTDELRAVVACGAVRRLAEGAVIFAQGDPGETCHSLVEGRVKIVQTRPDGGQSLLRFIGPGDMYGTVAALMGQPFPADAVAVVPSIEIRWSTAAMRELIARFPEIGVRATASTGVRLMEMHGRVNELSGDRVEQRLARALMRLARQAGRPTRDGFEFDFPITRQELAEMAGSTLHTVSRTLAAWDQQGITGSGRRRLTIRDRRALEALAETPHS